MPGRSRDPHEGQRVARGRRADVLLSDGSIARIRPATAEDHDALVALHEGVSRDNSRLRFFTTSTAVGATYVEHVLRSPETLALVVERGGELVGVGTAEVTAPGTAEIAFLVADRWHGLGIGSLLLEHLAAAGRDRGLRVFTAEVLQENAFMLRVFVDAGFSTTRHTDTGSVHVEMSTTASAAAVRAADRREAVSEARSMRPVLSPASVAVVGAPADGAGVGAAVLRAIVDGGYTGVLHAVHPDADTVGGVRAVRSLEDLPGGVDLVVVATAADRVPVVLGEAARAGCRGAVVLAAGPGDARPSAREPSPGLLDTVRGAGLRLLGPHSLGVLDNDPALRLDATAGCPVPPPGGLALATESGAVGVVLAGLARELGVGVRFLVSLGDKVDVSGNDLLAAWRDAPDVTAVGLYLESFGNGAKLARLARELGAQTPVMLVVGGHAAGGPVAAGLSALALQAGVLVCDTAEAMVQCAALLEGQPLPRGRRVAVLADARGTGVLAADAARRAGLVVLDPVEVRGDPRDLAAAAERLLTAGEVDALLLVLVGPVDGDLSDTLSALGEVRERHRSRPVLLVAPTSVPAVVPAGVTRCPTAAAAAAALSRVAAHADWRRRSREPEAPGREEDVDRASRTRAAVRRLLDLSRTDGRLTAQEAALLLADRGLAPQGTVGEGEAPPDARAAAVEMVVGLVQDPTFGPLVVVGAGGLVPDVCDDRQFLVAPLTAREAFRAVRGLRVWSSLAALPAGPGGVAGVVDLLERVSCLAEEVPGIVELGLDPVVVTRDDCRLLGVEVRVADVPAGDAGVPRRLRRPR